MSWSSTSGRPDPDLKVDSYNYTPKVSLRQDYMDPWDPAGFVLAIGRGYDHKLLVELRGASTIRGLSDLLNDAVATIEREELLHEQQGRTDNSG